MIQEIVEADRETVLEAMGTEVCSFPHRCSPS